MGAKRNFTAFCPGRVNGKMSIGQESTEYPNNTILDDLWKSDQNRNPLRTGMEAQWFHPIRDSAGT